MFNPMFTRTVQTELQSAIEAVLKKNGLRFKDCGTVDLRRARDQSFGRIMKFDIEPGRAVTVTVGSTAKPRLNKNASLDTAMKAFGITNKTNSKGDTLVSFHRNRPKYPFVYVSIRGARWKASADMAKRRFG